MSGGILLPLPEIQARVCDIASREFNLSRAETHPELRFIEDLNCDSLAMVEFFMTVEDAFNISLPDNPGDPIYKSVFTRNPFRLADMAELVYFRQGSGSPKPRRFSLKPAPSSIDQNNPFTQLGGRASNERTGTSRRSRQSVRIQEGIRVAGGGPMG